jgi:hypothetical protein
MMRKHIKVLCLVGVCSFVNLATAADYYFETAVTRVNFSEPGLSLSPSVLKATLGSKISDNFAIEGIAGLGSGTSNASYQGVNVGYKINSISGLYLKSMAKAGDSSEVYAKLGFSNISATVTASVPGLSSSLSQSGSSSSYGVGAKFGISKGTSVLLDYMSYYNKSGIKYTGPSIGLSFDF